MTKNALHWNAPAPEDCRSMSEVRAGVDEIDALLATILARRQGYMDAAARIKPDRSAVRDEARIEQVIDNVRRHAAAAGLSMDIAEPVWRLLVERCIAYEFEVFDRARSGG
jgi:isochorismate pyruvate lyase